MPILTRELIINVRDPGRAGILRSFSSQTTDTGIGELVRRDTETWGLRLVQPSDGANFFADIDLTGATVEIGLGIADLAPTGGTFSITYGGSSSGLTALPATITASALQAALNVASYISGGCTVVQQGNSFVISEVSTGTRTPITVVDSTQLVPQSLVTPTVVQAGTSTSRQIQVLTLAQANYAYANTFTPYPAAGFTVTTQQSGDASHASVRTLTLTPTPYGGTWLLAGVALPALASATAVQGALNGLYGDGAFTVTQPDSDTASYVITQTTNGTAINLYPDVSALQVPKGAVMTVQFNTFGMLAAFAATTNPTITLLLQGRLTLPGQAPFTFLLVNVMVTRDILSGALLPTVLIGYPPPTNLVQANPTTYALISPTAAQFYAANPPPASAYGGFRPDVTSVGTNVTGSLEQLPTVGQAVPFLVTFRDGNPGVLRNWILDTGTDTNSIDADGKPNVQRPNDYSSSNQKVWSRW